MAQETQSEARLAVLIDADNVSYEYVKPMMEEIARYGKPTIKRIYGDWTRPEMTGWKKNLLENAITPIQQYHYTSGKNASDSTLIIDAMDLLYSGRVDGFCIVSSDSDFTRLATRLREADMLVIGIGEKKTPEPFIVACDRFIYLEILKTALGENEENKKNGRRKTTNGQQPKRQKKVNNISDKAIDLISGSIDDEADDDGWAFLSDVANLILRKAPSFDPRNYGFSKLSLMLEAMGRYEMEKRDVGKTGNVQLYIRDTQADSNKDD